MSAYKGNLTSEREKNYFIIIFRNEYIYAKKLYNK